MRTLTDQQLATLTSQVGYPTYARVKVERSSTWHDLTAFLGLDWLEEVTWSESVDAPVATAQVRLLREVNGATLAPLMANSAANLVAGSYSPLLMEGHRFTVEVAVVPLGMAPFGWTEVFRGTIDEVDVGEDGISFSGRDEYGALMQDTYIKTEIEYGSTMGVAVQTVLQDILNDNGLSSITLYTPVSPGVVLGKYVQKCESVADAFNAIVQNRMGFEWRQRWLSSGPGTGDWRLWFYEPNRSASSADWVYGPGEYKNLSELRTSREDVRNSFECVYSDTADLDAAGTPKRKTVSTSDATSIADFGERFMRLAEDATSAINTSSEATALIGRAKADLKDRPLGVSFDVLLHPGLELGDMVKLAGNAVHFSADQTAAIISLNHTVNAYGGTTKLVLRGKPAISTRTWLAMEQRPHLGPASPFTGPDAPTNLASVATVQGFRVRFDAPTTGPGAASYELHVSTTSGFTPDNSANSTTRRAVGNLQEMVVTDLTPGTTYFARVVPRDEKGNRGTASSQLTLTPRYVEPRILQQRISWGSLPLNGDVEANYDSTQPPDTFRLNGGSTWNTHAQTTTDTYSGTTAILFPNTAVTTTLTAQPFTVREGEVWVFSIFYKQSASAGSLAGVLAFTYLDASLNAISAVSVNLGGSTVAANTWVRAAQRVTIPSGARFGEVSFSRDGSYSGTLTVDSVDALRSVGWGPWTNLSYSNSWSDANVGVYGNAQYRVNDLGEAEWRGVILAPSPAPAANATAFTLPAGVRPEDYARVFDRATGAHGTVRLTADTTGNVKADSITAGDTVSLDGIRYFTS